MSQPQSREATFPLLVDDGHLGVRGRDGSVVRLPLSGDRAVVALAEYRYTTTSQSSEGGQGTDAWTWPDESSSRPAGVPTVGGLTDRSGRRDPLSHEVGVAKGKRRQRSWALSWEYGTVALDRSGNALLRIRPLRGSREVRRVAGSCGLEFLEEQVTDSDRLGQAPEVLTRPLLGKRANRMISVIGLVLALLAGLAAFAAVAGDGLDERAVITILFTVAIGRIVLHWLLRWIAERTASG